MTTVLDIVFLSLITVGVFSNFYGAPGNFLIALSSLFHGITTGFESFSFTFVLTLFGIVILVEFLEFLIIAFSAKRYGSSKWGISGAIAGGILGAISGAFFTPVMGALIGSVIGVFLGAFALEMMRNRNLKVALISGFGAFIGRLGGLSIKMIGAVTMSIMVFSRII